MFAIIDKFNSFYHFSILTKDELLHLPINYELIASFNKCYANEYSGEQFQSNDNQ